MLLHNLIHIVLMAGGAGVGGVAADGMADGALQFPLLAVIEGEGVLTQPGRQPGIGRMTVGTVGAENAEMNGRLFVTGDTFGWRFFKHLINMTRSTLLRRVLTGERPHLGVVKFGHLPGAVVAILAFGAKECSMFGHERPVRFGMTRLAVSITHLQRIISGVAGPAGKWAAVKIGDVTGQAKAGFADMVKHNAVHAGRRPRGGCVTVNAVGAKQAGVFFRFGMAGEAVARLLLKFATIVTIFARSVKMCTGKGKDLGMSSDVKVGHRVVPVVAGKTILAVSGDVSCHERRVGVPVAVGTVGLGHCKRAFLHVAAGTVEGLFGIIDEVMHQRKVGEIVVEIG